jgi:purine-binding chemotaxis protein CheW
MSQEGSKSAEKARQAETSERYLAFLLGKEQYAIPLLQVKEVIEMSEPTPIPEAPPYFLGIINLRGQVISVIDLRSKLRVAKSENGPKTAIVILDIDPALSLAVIVDRVNSVLAFHHEDISAAPDMRSTNNPYLTGVARKDNRLTLILDIRTALGIKDIETFSHHNQSLAA